MIPTHARERHVRLNALQPQLWAELALLNDFKLNRSRLGVVTGGVSAKYVEEALKRLKLRPSLLKVTAYPIDAGLIKTLAENVACILVIEELEPVIEEQVLAAAPSVRVYGKRTGHIPRESELTVDLVMYSFETMLGRSTDTDIPVALSGRLSPHY